MTTCAVGPKKGMIVVARDERCLVRLEWIFFYSIFGLTLFVCHGNVGKDAYFWQYTNRRKLSIYSFPCVCIVHDLHPHVFVEKQKHDFAIPTNMQPKIIWYTFIVREILPTIFVLNLFVCVSKHKWFGVCFGMGGSSVSILYPNSSYLSRLYSEITQVNTLVDKVIYNTEISQRLHTYILVDALGDWIIPFQSQYIVSHTDFTYVSNGNSTIIQIYEILLQFCALCIAWKLGKQKDAIFRRFLFGRTETMCRWFGAFFTYLSTFFVFSWRYIQ